MKNTIRTFALTVIACLALAACNDKQYTITVVANNDEWGVANGGGTFDEGTTIQISGTPAVGYRFVKWNDGVTDNPRTITVEKDAAYVVIFADINGGSGDSGGSSDDPEDIVADSNAHFTVTFGDSVWSPNVLVKSNMGDVWSFLVYDNDNADNYFFSFSCPLATGTYTYAQNPRYCCYFMENSEDYYTVNGTQYPHYLAVNQCTIRITEYDAAKNLLSGTIEANLLNMQREADGLSQQFCPISVDFEKVYVNQY